MRRLSASVAVAAALVVPVLAVTAVAIAASVTYNDTVVKGKPVSVVMSFAQLSIVAHGV